MTVPDLAPSAPPDSDPYEAYWHPVATGAAHHWIALTTDWRVADRLMRQQCILLPGWPTVAAVDWLIGPDAADWWLPTHGRRVLITAWSDADAHLATLVMPVIEIQNPARLLFRSYRAVEEVNLSQDTPVTTSATTPTAGTASAGRNERSHAAAA